MLSEIFQRVYVVNLPRRKDRLDSFFNHIPSDWPFKTPEIFQALDGSLSPHPAWWDGGEGAWGCYRSHVRILEECLNNGIESVLILEDDAICVENFAEKARLFFEHLPQDWQMVYLGGQHLEENVRLPRKVNDWVYRPYNINRTHCFALRGRKIMTTIYRHLHDFNEWKVAHHIDHYLGELHKKMETGLYVPNYWLVEQDAGNSDVCCSEVEARRFQGAKELVEPVISLPGVAVLGNYFGGTNTIAGVMHCLGISLGHDIHLSKNDKEPQFFEDHWLSVKCRNCFAEPWLTEQITFEDRINLLRHWSGDQCRFAKDTMTLFAGKHPILSLMGPELLTAWNNPSFILVRRPDKDCVQRITKAAWGWHPDAVQYTVRHLRESQELFLKQHAPRVLSIDYDIAVSDPEDTIESLSHFLDILPTEQQKNNATLLLNYSKDDLVYTTPGMEGSLRSQ